MANTRYRGDNEASRIPEDDNQGSRRNGDGGDSLKSQITRTSQSTVQDIQPLTDDTKPSVGGFSIESKESLSSTQLSLFENVQKPEYKEKSYSISNYHFSETHHLYDGGPKTKFQNNVTAIRLLKELQEQERLATTEEQVTLAKFVGWGGLANALTPGKSGWETQYEEIKELLTEEEFQAAQESTLKDVYYTHLSDHETTEHLGCR
ncbi:MAG: hypothetical protein K2P03_03165, partial [Lachnospiraceae bacterium]|nr:hypothetical protein [Lachnospiraceae bacterium]